MYERGMDAEAASANVIMEKMRPWFERGSRGTWSGRPGNVSGDGLDVHEGLRYCSHQHAPTPDYERKGELLQKGNVIYCADVYKRQVTDPGKFMIQGLHGMERIFSTQDRVEPYVLFVVGKAVQTVLLLSAFVYSADTVFKGGI